MEAMNPKPVAKSPDSDAGGGVGACPMNPEDDEDCCDPGSD